MPNLQEGSNGVYRIEAVGGFIPPRVTGRVPVHARDWEPNW